MHPDRPRADAIEAGASTDNVSVVLDTALLALIERELERRWLMAHPDHDLPVDVPVDLADLPWDDA